MVNNHRRGFSILRKYMNIKHLIVKEKLKLILIYGYIIVISSQQLSSNGGLYEEISSVYDGTGSMYRVRIYGE